MTAGLNGFLWGSSISAYQAEGGITEDGKTLSLADLSTRKNGVFQNAVASGFYYHYREDIRLLAEMGATAFRFSLSWPRIIRNARGDVNEKGIAYYSSILDELEKYHITPIATLYHYDLPVFLQEKYGGWESREILKDFGHFCEVCFRSFGDRIKIYLTINEPDIQMMYGGHGLDLIGKDEYQRKRLIINHHFALANAEAILQCHRMVPGSLIGPVFGYVPVYSASSNPLDRIAAMRLSDIQNHFFEELFVHGRYMGCVLEYFEKSSEAPDILEKDRDLLRHADCDLIGLNYYKSDTAYYPEDTDQPDGKYPFVPGMYACRHNENLPVTKWGWDVDPIGIRVMLREVWDRYRKPLLICENGLAAEEKPGEDGKVHDEYRIRFMRDHIRECREAMREGVDLLGYCSWSFLDLLSTGQGFSKRYGLVYVDQDDGCRRIPKDSYDWYREFLSQEAGESWKKKK